MRAKLAATLAALLSLTGFSPPARAPHDVQQIVPKSWIPEEAPEAEKPKEPDIAVNVTPKAPSAFSHPTTVVCSATPNGPTKVKKEFVDSFVQAKRAIHEKRFEDAIAAAELAAGYAGGSNEWLAIEGIRIAAFQALQNRSELVAALEAALSTGCLQPGQVATYREMLDAARQGRAGPQQ